jgi:G3E family GTPase
MQQFDYIVIEASGICEPAPIAQTICSIPTMEPKYWAAGVPRLDCIVTVVDALRMKDEFGSGANLQKNNIGEEDIENLVIQQIEFCNIVLLNKAAEVEPAELDRIKQIIRALQPKADIIECNYGDVDFDRILHTGLFNFDKVATSAAWLEAVEGENPTDEDDEEEEEHHHHHDHDDDDDDDHDHEDEHHHHHHDDDDDDDDEHEEHHAHHHHRHHHHHDHEHGEAEEYGIGTYVYYARRPMNLSMFDDFVARLWPKNIIRAKGICYFKGEEQICYLFEQAGKQFSLKNCGQWYATMPKDQLERLLQAEPKLQRDWDEEYGDRMQKLVFIGQHMDHDMKTFLKETLDACLTV